jgi:hypothetical protein
MQVSFLTRLISVKTKKGAFCYVLTPFYFITTMFFLILIGMKYIWIILFLFSFNASAQVNTGARFSALASTGVSLHDVWSMQQNQAGLASITKVTAALAIEKPFVGYDLSTHSAIIIIPVKKNVFGISFQRYGFSSYAEQRTAFSYARSFGERFYAALNFNYHILKIQAYGSTQTYSVEAGVQYRVNPRLSIGAHMANPTRSRFDTDLNSAIPSRLQVGGSFQFSDKVLMAVAVEKVLGNTVDNKVGLEYQVVNLLSLRGGLSSNPFRHYAGFGLAYQKLKMDFAVTSQPILGYSPQVALSYDF